MNFKKRIVESDVVSFVFLGKEYHPSTTDKFTDKTIIDLDNKKRFKGFYCESGIYGTDNWCEINYSDSGEITSIEINGEVFKMKDLYSED